jgi:hypothetical protein|tara:strand:+ start:393 stop:521 length:129 start_codon:yes stop_codon:yes gene_type:complete
VHEFGGVFIRCRLFRATMLQVMVQNIFVVGALLMVADWLELL